MEKAPSTRTTMRQKGAIFDFPIFGGYFLIRARLRPEGLQSALWERTSFPKAGNSPSLPLPLAPTGPQIPGKRGGSRSSPRRACWCFPQIPGRSPCRRAAPPCGGFRAVGIRSGCPLGDCSGGRGGAPSRDIGQGALFAPRAVPVASPSRVRAVSPAGAFPRPPRRLCVRKSRAGVTG